MGFAICLFEHSMGDFYSTSSLAFYSISIPIKFDMLSIPKVSQEVSSSAAEDMPFASHVLEYPPNSSVHVGLVDTATAPSDWLLSFLRF